MDAPDAPLTCEACAIAEANPQSGLIQAGCIGCDAREIAKGPEAARRDADPSDLQAAMRKCWKSENDYRRGRVLVWSWIQKLEAT